MGYYHTFTNKDRAIAELETAIHNSKAEIEILKVIVDFTYSGTVFNARYATQLNKALADKFGTEVYKQWGLNREDKTVGLVYCNLINGIGVYGKGYELRVYYKAQKYDEYDRKITTRGGEYISFYNVKSADEIKDNATDMIPSRQEHISKMQTNIDQLAQLIEQYNNLTTQVMAFNANLTYPLSDLLRIK